MRHPSEMARYLQQADIQSPLRRGGANKVASASYQLIPRHVGHVHRRELRMQLAH